MALDALDQAASRRADHIMLVGSSGGHLAQLFALRPWWIGRERTWVTFDTPDAVSLLDGENVIYAHYPTTRNVRNLTRNAFLARRLLRELAPGRRDIDRRRRCRAILRDCPPDGHPDGLCRGLRPDRNSYANGSALSPVHLEDARAMGGTVDAVRRLRVGRTAAVIESSPASRTAAVCRTARPRTRRHRRPPVRPPRRLGRKLHADHARCTGRSSTARRGPASCRAAPRSWTGPNSPARSPTAHVVICHGGPATITEARNAGHLPARRTARPEARRARRRSPAAVRPPARSQRPGRDLRDRGGAPRRARAGRGRSDPHSGSTTPMPTAAVVATALQIGRIADGLVADVRPARVPRQSRRTATTPGAGTAAAGRDQPSHRRSGDRPRTGPTTARVLYIGGWGRSGSTLAERLLGEMPEIVGAGEVTHLWQRGLIDNELCACGTPFRDCPFWTAVGDRAFGGWDTVDAAVDHRAEASRRPDPVRAAARAADRAHPAPPGSGHVHRDPPRALRGDRRGRPAARSSSTRASTRRWRSRCGTTGRSTCACCIWSGTVAASPTRGPRRSGGRRRPATAPTR